MDAFLAFFNLTAPEEVRWSHATNSLAKFEAAVAEGSDVQMLEADVRLGSLSATTIDGGGDGEENTVIMAHPPATTSDLSLRLFLDTLAAAQQQQQRESNDAGYPVVSARKGMKLDFKDPGAVEPALKMLAGFDEPCPVWLNADVWTGPGGRATAFDAAGFFSSAVSAIDGNNNSTGGGRFRSAALSPGWTTGWYPGLPYRGGYTEAQVEEAAASLLAGLAIGSDGDGDDDVANLMVTLPVSAVHLRLATPEAQQALGDLVRSHAEMSLTVWGEAGGCEEAFLAEFASSSSGAGEGTIPLFIDTKRPGALIGAITAMRPHDALTCHRTLASVGVVLAEIALLAALLVFSCFRPIKAWRRRCRRRPSASMTNNADHIDGDTDNQGLIGGSGGSSSSIGRGDKYDEMGKTNMQ